MRYEATMDITPERARELIVKLAEDDAYREQFEANPREELASAGIEVGGDALPETVTLPEKQEIRLLLDLLETRAFSSGQASPLGWAIIIFMFGAMPVLGDNRPMPDGSG